MENKPLVIKVKDTAVPNVQKKQWTSIRGNMGNLTKHIITPDLTDNNNNIGAVVTGIPTIFARANIFKLSLGYVTDKAAETSGLMRFYESIVKEWRGLIACIALDYASISVERIYLKYSDGKGLNDTENIYEPTGAFGNMLFERKPLWCEQNLSKSEENADVPFIDVIKYRDKIVGGTSPDSFLFTSNAYAIEEAQPFINKQSKKFTDPIINASLNSTELSQLYGYIERIVSKIKEFEGYYSQLPDQIRPNYSKISGNLSTWMGEIKEYADKNRITIKSNIPPVDKFAKPFSIIFNFATEMYGSEGIVSEKADGLEHPVFFDPQQLLLDVKSEIARIDFGNEARLHPECITQQPIFVLTAKVKGVDSLYEYFALPLSPLGLNVFGNNLGTIVGIDNNINASIKTRLTAEFDPVESYLEVKMSLFTQEGTEKNLKKKYKVGGCILGHDILLWPNFISKQWDRYFMYSEIPHNVETTSCPFNAVPFVGNTDDSFFRILVDETDNTPLFLAKEGKIDIPEKFKNKIKARLHVIADSRVADNPYKYEIYESTLPFKGVKLMKTLKESGYIIIRYPAIHNYLQETKDLSKARLGIDFGSTNTSVAYYSEAHNKVVDQIIFKNRRLSLLADDNKDNSKNAAVEDEIFFFQNDEIKSNAIKSRFTIHNRKRLVQDNETSDVSLLAQAVKGGFPCFEKNLPVERVTDTRIILYYPKSGNAEIVHNMKWSNQDIENSYKTAYLASLLLHIYAQLFEEGHYPAQLKWSYPSSMGLSLIRQYTTIWDRLNEVNPLADKASYALEILKPNSAMQITGENNQVFGQSQLNSGWGGSTAQPTMNWGNPAQGNTFGNNTWGTPQPTNNGFNAPTQSNGWGTPQPQTKSVNIKVETGPIKFNFSQLKDNFCLTEACAVANFIANQNTIDTTLNHLTLCFDVGGSTTDISALCRMKGGDDGIGLAMVKQNSIRFAAQRVATATQYSPNFKSVLLEFCEQKGLKIQGLNFGNSKYSPETAPYYYEQIIDRIDDSDFPSFYQLINGKCPEMMSVNLYVTGLIMFYAGQLAHKLIQEIQKSEDRIPCNEGSRHTISIVFAGKGARLFDWLKITNQQVFDSYYTQQFFAGFGGIDAAKQILSGPPIINPTNQNYANIKYEVSKGLALPARNLLVPQKNEAIEILGEEGFVVTSQNGERISLPYDSSLTNEMMEHTGTYFMSAPQPGQPPCPKFMEFASIFFECATSLYGLKMTQQDFINGFNGMNINSYITTLPEYYAAKAIQKETQKFDFVAPIIILEGMKFYDDYLLKSIAK